MGSVGHFCLFPPVPSHPLEMVSPFFSPAPRPLRHLSPGFLLAVLFFIAAVCYLLVSLRHVMSLLTIFPAQQKQKWIKPENKSQPEIYAV